MSLDAAPFLKFAGGKRRLAHQILRHFPKDITGSYHEPFLGGGAVFFAAANLELLSDRRPCAYLSDTLAPLVDAWRGVQQQVEHVAARLRSMKNERAFFEKVRGRNFSSGLLSRDAADFIYCNRVGFNGLVRFNRSGQFNVPFGKYRNPTICDGENLRACADALQPAEVFCADFEEVRFRAERGDVVYFDPPYFPASETSDFVGYAGQPFGMAEQHRLADLARDLRGRGVHVVLTNADVPAARALYHSDFKLRSVKVPRAINSDGAKRGDVRELIIY